MLLKIVLPILYLTPALLNFASNAISVRNRESGFNENTCAMANMNVDENCSKRQINNDRNCHGIFTHFRNKILFINVTFVLLFLTHIFLLFYPFLFYNPLPFLFTVN